MAVSATRTERRTVRLPTMAVPVVWGGDVLVAGGGVAGVGAAVAAGRLGARTLLVERQSTLGGTATSAMMALFYTPYYCTHGLLREITDRLVHQGAAFPGELIPFDHEALKLVLLDMAEEARVQLLFHSLIVDVLVEEGAVRGVVVANKGGLGIIAAGTVVDTSGDADVAARANAECAFGRETDGKTRPMTLLFRMGGIDVSRVLEYVRTHPEDFSRDPNQTMVDLEHTNIRLFGFFRLVARAKASGDLYEDCHYFRIETVRPDQGTAVVNTTRIYGRDGTNPFDVSAAEVEGRRQMLALQRFATKYVPGFEGAYILDSAAHIGVRETRRIVGHFILDEDDIVEGRRFEDSIGVDSNRNTPGGEKGHSPDGGEGSATDADVRTRVAPLITYEIPYRVLLPRGVRNLLVGGRCISATHAADAFTRNQPACMTTGQAAGTAAVLAARRGISADTLDVRELQGTLEKAGVVLRRDEMLKRIERAGAQTALRDRS